MAVRIDRNARPLIGLVVLLAILAGLMLFSKTYAPKLGLDLQGGTTITLTARNTSGSGQVDANSLNQARQIIQNRVDSLGVGESEVTTSGTNQITVSVPNVNADALVKRVGQTAVLNFRAVYIAEQQAPAVAPSGAPSGSASTGPSGQPTGSAPTGSASAGTPSSNVSSSQSVGPSSSTSGNGRPFPHLPPAPVPSAGSSVSMPPGVPENQAMSWQPTDAAYAIYTAYKCGDPVGQETDQPVAACNVNHTEKYLLGPTVISGKTVTTASAGIKQNEVAWSVDLSFNPQGAAQFADVTGQLATKQDPMNRFAIVLDGVVQSAPSVSQSIGGGVATISGSFNADSAQELANVLKYGALPLAFDTSSVDNVSAVLGGEQLHAGLVAGLIGLILVVLYCFIYYRGLGVVVILSLVVAGAFTYALMSLLGQSVGFALNLPGIAGAIVAIGLTADSFIIYFERIRDEVRDGRSLRSAVATGWKRARRTILIADSVSLLSAVVLFILAIGSVKGFAFTLGLTTAIDIGVVFFFTRPFMSLLTRTRFYGGGHRLSGLDQGHLGAAALPGRAVRKGIA